MIAKVLREIGYVREMGEGMRRIFWLMQDADLVPPDLDAEANRFIITLKHKSVFSDAEQKWLDGYKPLKLTREEMLIALMGRNGDLLSPRQIYDRLQLVDWDIYREIVDQIQAKGILYNTLSESEKVKRAKAKHVSQRDVSRLAIRQPEDLEVSLAELFASFQKVGPTSQLKFRLFWADAMHLGSKFEYKFLSSVLKVELLQGWGRWTDVPNSAIIRGRPLMPYC